MDIWSFLASIMSSLAWPGTIFAIVILLRKPIGELIPLLRNIRYKNLEIDFGRRLEKLEVQADRAELPSITPTTAPPDEYPLDVDYWDTIERLSEVSPRAAISEAWRRVEWSLDDYFQKIGKERPGSYQGMLRSIRAQNRHVPPAMSLLQDLRILRNKAVHAREFDIDSQRAIEFAQLAERIVASLGGEEARESNIKSTQQRLTPDETTHG
jgi:hypothetical protein